MLKIMVVDDERDVVELLDYVLKDDEYEVFHAFSGKEALEMLGILPSDRPVIEPDLLVLDVLMPDIDGYTVQTKMLDNDKTRNIPIVVLSAKEQMKELFSVASNVVAYIDKPFDPDYLKTKIRVMVQNIKSKRETK